MTILTWLLVIGALLFGLWLSSKLPAPWSTWVRVALIVLGLVLVVWAILSLTGCNVLAQRVGP